VRDALLQLPQVLLGTVFHLLRATKRLFQPGCLGGTDAAVGAEHVVRDRIEEQLLEIGVGLLALGLLAGRVAQVHQERHLLVIDVFVGQDGLAEDPHLGVVNGAVGKDQEFGCLTPVCHDGSPQE
jgi:hypothetical protein